MVRFVLHDREYSTFLCITAYRLDQSHQCTGGIESARRHPTSSQASLFLKFMLVHSRQLALRAGKESAHDPVVALCG